jgi:hypothetical protein
MLTAFTISSAILTIFGISRKSPAPAPFEAIFFIGHPKLISIKSGLDCSATLAAITIESIFEP